MKIGHISYGYKPITGGQQTYIANLIKVFNEEGHSQRVYQSDVGINSSELRPIPKLPKFLRYRAAGLYAYNLFILGRYLELRKEDALIVHYAFHYPPVSWHNRVIVVSHGVEWDEPPIKLNHRIRKKIAEITFGSSRCKLVANDTDYFRKMGIKIKPKENLFQEVVKNKWFIPNCIDTTYFKRNDGLEKLKKLNPILVPRNIVRRRGIQLAIEAFARFVKRHPETNLVIVGHGFDNNYMEELVKLTAELGLREKVRFWGPVDWQDMPSIYSSGLMTLIPSIFGEGTSISALESMACETPTIATNVGGLSDLPCVLASPAADSLSQAMLDTFEVRNEIAKSQYREVTRNYNLENWRRAWLEIIKAL